MPSDHSIEKPSLSPDKLRERTEALDTLRRSAGVVYFMDQYAKLVDEFGGDVLVGLLPGIGDAGSTIVSIVTQMVQASRVKLPLSDRLAIIASQLADLGIGAVPVIGDIADYLYKSNVGARDRFVRHFESQLKDAWTKGFIAPADVQDLSKRSGVTLKMAA